MNYLCVCNKITKSDVLDLIVQHDTRTAAELSQFVTICDRCKLCESHLNDCIDIIFGKQ